MSLVIAWGRDLFIHFMMVLSWWFSNWFCLYQFINQAKLLSIIVLMIDPWILIKRCMIKSTTRVSWPRQRRIRIMVALKRRIGFIFTLYALHILNHLIISFHIWLSFSDSLRWIIGICIAIRVLISWWVFLFQSYWLA